MSFLNTYNYGIFLRTLSSSQIWRIHISSSFLTRVLSLQSQHMKPSLLVQFYLPLGKEFGIAGPLASADFPCGLQHIRNVGQLIDLQKKDSLTRQPVLFVTKIGKPLTICWYPVYLVGKYGLMFYNTLAYRSWHHKLGKGHLRIGERPQTAGFQGKYRRVSIPSSFYVPGPCGITAIVVYLMAFHLTLPMSSRL